MTYRASAIVTRDADVSGGDRVMSREEYGQRAARKFLDAWDRQDGVCYTVGCGITYAANMLGKYVNATGTPLPGDAFTWWGTRYRMLALALTWQEAER